MATATVTATATTATGVTPQQDSSSSDGTDRRSDSELLVSWIASHGGYVHPSLTVRDPDDDDDDDGGGRGRGRGVFAASDISEGETLIRLPAELAVGGGDLPERYRCRTARGGPSVGGGGGGARDEDGVASAEKAGKEEEGERAASPWLRCVASLLSAVRRGNKPPSASLVAKRPVEVDVGDDASSGDCFFEPYLCSLPSSYRTLLSPSGDAWSDDDVRTFLGGTALCEAVLADRRDGTLRERYRRSVLPYLRHVGIEARGGEDGDGEKEGDGDGDGEDDPPAPGFDEFVWACETISTRGFHLRPSPDDNGGLSAAEKKEDSSAYSGPFLLPYIDLLNHSSDPSDRCTTLRRHGGGGGGGRGCAGGAEGEKRDFFVMTAERLIRAGEEILHSYGNNDDGALCAATCLRTFGFVEGSASRRAAASTSAASTATAAALTPAVLSRSAVLESCRRVASSEFPSRLESTVDLRRMRRRRKRRRLGDDDGRGDGGNEDEDGEEDDGDETWDLGNPLLLLRSSAPLPSALTSLIPSDILVDATDPLSDELVTLCCLPFLPEELYQEWITDEPCLWRGEEVLEDYFLGKLALQAVLGAVEEKMEEYGAMSVEQVGLEGSVRPRGGREGKDSDDDRTFLSLLLNEPSPSAAPGPRDASSDAAPPEDDDLAWKRTKARYGLTVRIEEKYCLEALRREASRRSTRLSTTRTD